MLVKKRGFIRLPRISRFPQLKLCDTFGSRQLLITLLYIELSCNCNAHVRAEGKLNSIQISTRCYLQVPHMPEFLESPFSRLDFESETDQSWTSSPILTWLEHRYPIPSPIPSLKPRDSVFRV